jgi:hypothetical protein
MLGSDEVNATMVAGDYIRVGTATTSAVYLIDTVTSGTGATPAGTPMTLTLDVAFQGESTILAIDTETEYITAAQGTAADWGVKITGLAANFDVNKFRNFYVNRFTATFSDEGTTPITHLQGAYTGNGVWQQVAMDEYMTYGFEGQNEMLGTPPTMRDQYVKIPGSGSNTAASSRYSVLNIAWYENIDKLTSSDNGKGSVIVYLNLNTDTLGLLDTGTANVGETLVVALGLTAADFDMV